MAAAVEKFSLASTYEYIARLVTLFDEDGWVALCEITINSYNLFRYLILQVNPVAGQWLAKLFLL